MMDICRCVFLLVLHQAMDMTFGDQLTSTSPATTSTTTQAQFKPNLNRLNYTFSFRVDVNIPYGKAKSNKTAAVLKTEFSTKLAEAFKNSDGFYRIDVSPRDIHFGEGNLVTCNYKAVYRATVALPVIVSDIDNNIISKIRSQSIFRGGIMYQFLVNDAEMKAILFQASSHLNNTCKVKQITPCPNGYTCVDKPYLHCIHRCQYGSERLMCQNDGHCFFDSSLNNIKCSCVETDTYVYSGALCEEKVEKLALKLTYIIAIAAGGGGGVILLLVIVVIVMARRGRAKKNKDSRPVDNGYAMTSLQGDDDGDRNRPRSKISLDGVHNDLYSDTTDLRFLDGRSHSVLKDDRGREIYVYNPTSAKGPAAPSRRSSTDVDATPSRPSSYYGGSYSNGMYGGGRLPQRTEHF